MNVMQPIGDFISRSAPKAKLSPPKYVCFQITPKQANTSFNSNIL